MCVGGVAAHHHAPNITGSASKSLLHLEGCCGPWMVGSEEVRRQVWHLLWNVQCMSIISKITLLRPVLTLHPHSSGVSLFKMPDFPEDSLWLHGKVMREVKLSLETVE